MLTKVLSHWRSRWRDQVDCGAETCGLLCHAQLQRNALSDQCDLGLHSLVRRLSAELPAHRGDDGRARRVSRPFDDQPMGDPLLADDRENGPQTQAPDRQQLAHG